MSAEDRREGPGEEPRTDETPEAPETGGVSETAADGAPETTPEGGPAPEAETPAEAGPWSPPGAGAWSMRAQGGHGHFTSAGAFGAPAGGNPAPQYPGGHHTGQPYPGGHTAPQPGIGGAGAAPPNWPGAVPPAGGGPGGPEGGGGKRKRPGPVAIAAATALVTSLIVGPAAAVATTYLTGGSSSPVSSLTGGTAGSVSSGNVSEVAEKVLPSVVSIETESGSGSGVVISSDGQILTNAHVVAGARGDSVRVRFNDGSDAEARVVGTDEVSDIAVIEAKGVSGLTPATLGDSDKVEVGADVVAIGSPLGLSGTVTSGVVSAVDRPVNTGTVDGGQEREQDPFGMGAPQQEQGGVQTSTVINAIQTDAPINPGNSGGPLINMNGEVIGINTAIAGTSSGGQGEAGSIGLGFSIPINQAKPIAEQLIDQGSADYAAIDATVAADKDGVRIVDTSKGGAAAEAGLKGGDVVTSVDGDAVDSPDALIAKIRSKQPGDTVKLGITRDGKEQEVDVKLAAQSADSIGG
ncbi:trypsin-like peptidase domain-containing protein [Nocardiopsis sp. RSe5-2]|uniref:Trypsin-like peptidase domain-containing protein n=1 Tax=Nocardiopsis endophytica TaxID=3018445 RepID=A0ABT4TX42_9ACTN|nr:trypsin-like peptidase domain-containing protein [Nocardiopsis endophytica]MDA2809257.1 trypsin-like peptidase domain-containing protein [Nocardiopsis endophytica]